MEEGFEPEVVSVRPRGVVCCYFECLWWAVAYTTLEDNPKPWPVVTDEQFDHMFDHVVVPLWYVCGKHVTEKHRPLPDMEKRPPVCELCGSTQNITWVGGMTAYHFQPTVWQWIQYGPIGPPSPNRDVAYCAECGDDYRTHWEAQWAEYRSSAGY